MKAIKLKRVVISEEIFSITNDTIESIVLGQMIYWQSRVSDIDDYINQEKARCNNSQIECKILPMNGWIYKSSKELKSECMLDISETTIIRIINSLIEKGYISKRNNPIHKWDKTLQYRVNMVKVINDIKKNGYDGFSGWLMQNDELNPQNEKSKIQNEELNLQNEGLKMQIEGAIPEITTENTTEIITKTTTTTKKDVVANEKNWRNNYSEYISLAQKAYSDLLADSTERKLFAELYPDYDYDRTLKNCYAGYWGMNDGWENKKKSKSKNIDMTSTLKKAIRQSFNLVRKPYSASKVSHGGYNKPFIPPKKDPTAKIMQADGTYVMGDKRYYKSSLSGNDTEIPINAMPMPQRNENLFYEWNRERQEWEAYAI